MDVNNNKWTRFDLGTGRIRGNFSCPVGEANAQLQAGEGKYEGIWPWETHYISVEGVGVPTARPENPASPDKTIMVADGVDEVEISSIPNPSTVRVSPFKGIYDVTDGVFQFTVDVEGTYRVEIDSFPAKPKTIEIIANAS